MNKVQLEDKVDTFDVSNAVNIAAKRKVKINYLEQLLNTKRSVLKICHDNMDELSADSYALKEGLKTKCIEIENEKKLKDSLKKENDALEISFKNLKKEFYEKLLMLKNQSERIAKLDHENSNLDNRIKL